MAFIETIPAHEATGAVRQMYARLKADWGFVPDYAKVFCYRPRLMDLWGDLLDEINVQVNARRRELVTFAAAHELNNSSCSLAHGESLAAIVGKDAVMAIAAGQEAEVLPPEEAAILRYARKVARDAAAVDDADVAELKNVHGLTDAEIFDVAAIAASRAFFTKLLDAVGSEPDKAFLAIDEDLRRTLTVGRPISSAEPERCKP